MFIELCFCSLIKAQAYCLVSQKNIYIYHICFMFIELCFCSLIKAQAYCLLSQKKYIYHICFGPFQWVVKGNLLGLLLRSPEHGTNLEMLFRDHKHEWFFGEKKINKKSTMGDWPNPFFFCRGDTPTKTTLENLLKW